MTDSYWDDLETRERFEIHAAPGAIDANLEFLLKERTVLDRRIQWLTELLGRRTAEQGAGVWPTERNLQ